MKKIIGYALALMFFASCAPSVPENCSSTDRLPNIYPHYTDVTIPCNIAPLTFRIEEKGSGYITRLSTGEKEFVVAGKEIALPVDKWHELLAVANGGRISVDVYVKGENGWEQFRQFGFDVSSDPIDPYISYRLIPPSYVAYENLSICQRKLSSFDEDVIYSNNLVPSEPEGQCINCHAYKAHKTDNMQFHARQHLGGTVFVHDGVAKKVNLKTD